MNILLATSSLVLCSSALAQQQLQPVPATNLKDLGTYHLATDTWTHGSGSFMGAKTLYRNDAPSGFFGVTGQPGKLIWTDEGRIPSTSGHANAKSDSYVIQSTQIAYCTQNGPVPHTLGLTFYGCYASCTDPALWAPPAADFQGISVPGSPAVGTTACWLVTFDFKGTTDEFTVMGDCDGIFDGSSALDDFGWTFSLDFAGGGGGFMGPVLCGDPNNVPYGDGTYYQNSLATYGTGLSTMDQFWLTFTAGGLPAGCYWFGGYAGANPFASFWQVLGGDNLGDLGTKYCVANSNSAGAPADISASGSASSGAGNLTLTSQPVPNQNSIFFHAANQAQVPFGCSFLCATGNIIRGAVTPGAGNVATYTYDNSDVKHSLGGFIGAARNFQHWYRDPMGAGMCGGQTFNTSNAIQITVLP